MGTEIFLPMFYLVLLTTVVFLLATSLRLKEIYLDKILNKNTGKVFNYDEKEILDENSLYRFR